MQHLNDDYQIKINIYNKQNLFKVLLLISVSINIFVYININIKIKKSNNIINSNDINNKFEKCYLSPDNTNIKIKHLIITRFIMDFWHFNIFPKIIYRKDYAVNGIRLMKKYLIPSLENQICKRFTWILMLGDKANITFIKSLFNFKISFEFEIIYQHNIKNYIRNLTNGIDILITSRIDYDDRIYYDAVNDVRKAINFKKPIFLYGYNRGVHYYESDNKYYEFNMSFNNEGVMSIFVSLIIVLNKVNDTYIVYDLGHHPWIKKTLLKSFRSFGINKLDYDPAFFDDGDIKFVWVRHNYSGQYLFSKELKNKLNPYNFNLNHFYGK